MRTGEQVIDRTARIDLFQGREVKLITGRVLLHALDSDGHPLCDCDQDELTPIEQPWDSAYLPHLPRCRACLAAQSDGVQAETNYGPNTGTSARLSEAGGIDIRTAHGSSKETAGAAALRAVLAEHDLRRWMFTNLVVVDERIDGGFSHPLTPSPGLLVQRPELALTSFLHEQVHWLEGPGTDDATAEARERWPDPPPFPAGARDAQSTWLHMSACALEHQSLAEILGTTAAADELRQHDRYSWIYSLILAEPCWFTSFLHRHGLHVPEHPPIPRRYFGDAWWTS